MTAMVTATAAAAGTLMFLQVDFLLNLAQLLFGARASPAAPLFVLGAAAAVAAMSAPRVCAGLGGWLRHLPVAGATHRRAATAAVALAEAPLLAVLVLLVLAAGSRPGAATAPHLAGLLVVAVAAAQISLPARRRLAVVPPALAAGLLAGLGSWPALAAALPLLAAADLAAGQLRSPRHRDALREQARAPSPPLQVEPRTAAPGPSPVMPLMPQPPLPGRRRQSPPWARDAGSLLPARIAWRALGWRPVRAYGLALLPWLAAILFSRNNQLVPLHADRAALLGGGGSCVLALASLAGTLATRRPAWPWARSLPWTARRRALADALLLGTFCLPLVALAGLLAAAAVPPLAVLLPLLAVCAAAAIRRPLRPAENRLGPAGEILMEGLLLAGLVALLPWAAVPLLASAPLAVRAAAARERRQKAGIWIERHHLAAGDPQSWSGG